MTGLQTRPRTMPSGTRPATNNLLDALMIGAGQSGLAAAYHLRRAGFRFTVLEAAPAPGGSWSNHYASLRLFSAARYASLPGMAFPGDPDHLPARDEVTDYLRRYAAHFSLPVITRAPVDSVRRTDDGAFAITDSRGRVYRARTVIVATGAFRTPHVPDIPGLDRFQGRLIHSADYDTPKLSGDGALSSSGPATPASRSASSWTTSPGLPWQPAGPSACCPTASPGRTCSSGSSGPASTAAAPSPATSRP